MRKRIIKSIAALSLVALFAANTISVSANAACVPHYLEFVKDNDPVITYRNNHQFIFAYLEGKAIYQNCIIQTYKVTSKYKCESCNYSTNVTKYTYTRHENTNCPE